jgi:hypothetical protein
MSLHFNVTASTFSIFYHYRYEKQPKSTEQQNPAVVMLKENPHY